LHVEQRDISREKFKVVLEKFPVIPTGQPTILAVLEKYCNDLTALRLDGPQLS
jgi:hypothetical protein